MWILIILGTLEMETFFDLFVYLVDEVYTFLLVTVPISRYLGAFLQDVINVVILCKYSTREINVICKTE